MFEILKSGSRASKIFLDTVPMDSNILYEQKIIIKLTTMKDHYGNYLKDVFQFQHRWAVVKHTAHHFSLCLIECQLYVAEV